MKATSWSKVDHAAMDIPRRGSTVQVVIADKVTCVCCGKECYAEETPYVCHNCWKTGNVGKFIAELQSFNTEKVAEIAALQDRVAGLQAFAQRFLENFEPCDYCNATGEVIGTDLICDTCQGTGMKVSSRGVLFVELTDEANDLVGKVKA